MAGSWAGNKRAFAFLAVAGLIVTSMTGANRNWMAGDADWATPANWTPAGKPVANDQLFIDNGSGPIVTTNSGNVARYVVIGNTANTGGKLLVQPGGRLDLALYLYVGSAAGTTGYAEVNGGILNMASSRVGLTGAGTLMIRNGGVMTANDGVQIGRESGGDGTVTVTGAGSKLTTTGSGSILYLGLSTTGRLNILDGGAVEATRVVLANNISGVGTVRVDGAGSRLSASADLIVGLNGTATLDITNGARVSATGPVYAGWGGTVNTSGTITVDGAGSSLGSGAGISIGGTDPGRLDTLGGAGVLTVANGGAVTSASDTLLLGNGRASESVGTLNLGAGGAPGTIGMSHIQGGDGLAVVNFNHNDPGYLFTPDIAGPRVLVQQVGPGATVLTADHAFRGLTTIGGGTLQLGNGGATGSVRSDIIDDSHLVLNRSDAVTYAGAISGTGDVTLESGGGTLFTGDNTYAGTTFMRSDTLQLGDGGGTGSVAGPIVNDTLLTINRDNLFLYRGSISGLGAVTQAGPGLTVFASDQAYGGLTSITGGTLQLGAGGAGGGVMGDIANQSHLVFNRGSPYVYGQAISGTGTLTKLGPNRLTLTGTSTYTGATTVAEGALVVDGSLATGSLAVDTSALLGGHGSIAGTVTIADNAFLAPGVDGGRNTLTVGALILNDASQLGYRLGLPGPGFIGSPFNDLVNVTGDLTLDGILNVNNGGGFTQGVYRLINYGGTLTDHGLHLGLFPAGFTPVDFTIQTAPGQVNLVVSAGGLFNQFWDGPHTSANDFVDGGTEAWTAHATNWTNAAGSVNAQWAPGFAIFAGSPGVVTLGHSPGAAGLQFLTDGYLVTAGSSSFAIQADPDFLVRTDPGVTATVSATIADGPGGPASLTKIDPGTLVLSGANTYSGGTRIYGGTLGVSADHNLGAAGATVSLNDGTLRFLGGFKLARNLTLNVAGGTLDTNGFDTTYDGLVTGTGVLTKTGAGTLTITGRQESLGGTLVAAGTLQLGDGGTTGRLLGPLVNHGTLIFNRSDDTFVYAGAVSGTGSFIKRGPGTLTLTGASTTTGRSTIESGTLRVNGSLVSPVTIAGGGILTGSGAVGATTNGGRLVPGDEGIGEITINGDYFNLAAGVVEAEGDASGAGDVIRVNGAATLQGGMIDLRPAPGTYVAPLRYLLVDTTAGVTGHYTGILQDYAAFDVRLEYTPLQVFVVVDYKRIDNPDVAAISFNTDSVAAALDAIHPEATGEIADRIDTVIVLPPGEAGAVLNGLTGEIHPTTAALLNEGHALFGQSITRRLAEVRAGAMTAGWIRAYGVLGNLDSDGNGPGADYDLAGLAAGLDHGFSSGCVLGASFNASEASVDFKRYQGRADARTYDAALYGSRAGEHWYLDGVLAYAWLDTTTRRQIELGGQIRHIPTARYDGQRFAAYFETGRLAKPGRWLRLEPVATIQYTWQRQDGFAEANAGDLGLRSGAFTGESLRTGLGGRLGCNLALGGWRLSPELRVRWLHEFLDEYSTYRPAFIGAPSHSFEIRGTAIDRDSYVGGAGLTFAYRENLLLNLDYDLRFNADIAVNNLTAGVRFAW